MTEQNLANHAKFVPPFHFFALPVLIINFGIQVYLWIRLGFVPIHFFTVLLAAAFVIGFISIRVMVMKVQDRVIRVEERFRFERLLPADLQARIGELTIDQVVALRFASDAELPALTRKVLDEKLTQRKVIKQLIKTWRPDYQRA